MNNKKQAVTIKGTKDGLTFIIDDTCSFADVLQDIEEKLSSSLVENEHPMLKVTINVGNRYLTTEMEQELLSILNSKKNLKLQDIISNVILKSEAEEWLKKLEVTTVTAIIRSGQSLHFSGDVLLIGDVNPSGKISATGNIYILGKLKGIAHAGSEGNRKKIVAAAYMNPTQVRIADLLSRAPDFETEGVYMEYAYVDEDTETILIDRLQSMSKIRPNKGSFERSIING